MTHPPAPETLQHGRDPRAPRRRHRAWEVVAVLGLLCVVAAAAVVDHRLSVRDTHRVAGCVVAATGAVTFSSTRVDAIVSYVRPVVDSGAPRAQRRRLLGLISSSVAPTVPGVRRARDRCASAQVLPWHGGPKATRAGCLQLLDRDLTYLREVVASGSRALGSRSLAPGRCRA